MYKLDEYYLGFDIGTNSVGWAVTDNKYKVLKFNGKSMWGVRMFDEGKTALERRIFRAVRRRKERQKFRLSLLEDLFKDEISKKDMGFFMRLKESAYYKEDKSICQKNALFNDINYKDKDYHKEYPTIHHLIKHIIDDKSPVDIRLLFLAIHYLIKNRGHFLFAGDFKIEGSFNELFNNLKKTIEDDLGIVFDCDLDKIEKILGDKSLGITRKKESLIKEIKIDSNDKTAKEIIKAICNLLSGGKESIKKIFSDVENEDVAKIQFSSANYDEDKDKLEAVLNEKILLIEQLKALYDWSVLEEMLKFADADKDGIKRISSAKVNIYNQHKDDLKKLKKVIKNHYTAKDYNDIFRSKNIENNYVLYSGKPIINSKNKVITNCTQAEFCDFLKKNYFNKDFDDDLYKEVKEKVVNGILLPKQVNSGNGVIPYQLKKADLIKMLDNAEKYFEFLKVSDNYGSVKDKIIKLMEFRIPYYIGPINPYHKDGIHCWVERKIEHEKVMPWNFNDVIDVETTREKFITTRTNKCTYLLGEDVLPKESLLYSEFMILNELNNLRFSGKTLDEINSGLKSEIFNHLYKKERKVTINKIKELMKCKGINTEDLVVSGVNGDLKANYKSYLDFNFILGNEIEKENTKNMIEDIIKYIVIFGAEKQVLKEMLKKKFGDNLTNDQIKKIVKLNYKEWGRLSRKLLTGIEGIDNNTGEYTSIIGMMRSTNNIFMELLSKDKYTFLAEIEKNNNPKNIDKLKYEVLDDLYVSPAVKRSLWQTLKITNEVVKIMKHSPKKVFIEMTREHSDNHNQKDSRKEFLKKIYSKLEDEYKDVGQCCDKIEDRRFRSDRIFLYFTQLGRCAYSNRTIDFEDIFNENIYDIDHIYPKSKFYDDGIDNKVLVLKEYNAKKDNKYPLVDELSHFRQERLWKILRQKELISEKKYQRLMRKEPFSDKELSEFIARQLVETSQSAKASAEILKNYLTKNNEET